MKPEQYFAKLRTHIDNEGAASVYEIAALEAWENGDKHAAGNALSYHDLMASGGLGDFCLSPSEAVPNVD